MGDVSGDVPCTRYIARCGSAVATGGQGNNGTNTNGWMDEAKWQETSSRKEENSTYGHVFLSAIAI